MDDSTLSTTRAIIGLPDLSVTSSLLCGAIRRDRPAASTTAAMVGALRGAARCRGVRRRLLARQRARRRSPSAGRRRPCASCPPGSPSGRRTAGSARSRCRSASGCGRSPAAPAPGASPMRPRQIRLPGSTGMPKCRISPPARTMPCRPDIAPVHHRGGADDQQQVGAGRRDQPLQRAADRVPRRAGSAPAAAASRSGR